MSERSIFMEALEFDVPRERAAYIRRACGGDERLRARVEALLRRHQSDDLLALDRMPTVELAVTADRPPTAEHSGTVLGLYKLLREIGEGGMGTVYLAEQTRPVKRLVALKVIKAGMDTRQVIARFEAERQALALMDHPNIARVLDAGATEPGRPYFVMELVQGVPITDYCDRERLPISERLALFVPVCQAVQHAHQKGVIHRDLKPSNVLVTMVDGAAVPKVIDFGVAKAIGQPLTEKTLLTGFAQLVGTPLYMSPEQADLSGADVDTRSDIYSLGVLLYELLTGTTPFDRAALGRGGWDEARRLIRETEPPLPSTRLSGLGGALAAVSADRGADPRRLRRSLGGELEWIVMKCLEKDRQRRYDTANSLAADVRRHLNHEPVLAGPPSSWYRLRKFGRRNRVALSTAVLAAAALVSMAVVSVIDANRQRDSAKRISGLVNELSQERESLRKSLVGSNRLLAIRNFERGQAAFEDGQIGSGLLWMTQSWRSAVAAGDRALQHAARANLAAWRPRHPLLKAVLSHAGPVEAAAFSPDCRAVLTGSDDRTARLWGAASGQPLGPPLAHSGSVLAVAFSPDGQTVLTGGSDGTARLWDAATAKSIAQPLPHQNAVHAVAFRPDGRTVLTGSWDQTARLWDARTGQAVGPPLRGHRGKVLAVAFHPHGRIALTGSEDQTARLWDTASDQTIGPPLKHQGPVVAAAFSPDGRTILTASKDGTVRLWEADPGQPVGLVLEHQGQVDAVAFRPDGRAVLTGSWDQTARLWDAASGQPLGPPLRHPGRVHAVASSPDGRTLLTGCGSPPDESGHFTAWRWDAATGQAIGPPLKHHRGEVTVVAFSPEGTIILTGGQDGTIRLWDAATGRPLGPPLQQPGTVDAGAFSPDGKTFLAGYDIGRAQLWDVSTWTPLGPPFPHHGAVSAVAFSPDGKTLLTGCEDRMARLWDLASRSLLSPPLPHPGWVFGVAFSPDGEIVATGCREGGRLQLWDAHTGQPLGPPLPNQDAVTAVAFSPDGKAVVTGHYDHRARLFRLAPGLPDDLERVATWVEVLTGLTLDAQQGSIRVLDNQAWLARSERLRRLGGPPEGWRGY